MFSTVLALSLVAAIETRCIRVNNPGCIDRVERQVWQGEVRPCTDSRIACFENPIYGIRAQAMILLKYQKDYNLRTIRDIIDRYAPATENSPDTYARYIAEALSVDSGEEIDFTE
ncbi:MAG: structural protein P5, partial [Candidatus Thorarchaeota archaeon]